MSYVVGGLRFAVFLYMIVLLGRLALSWIFQFSREWRPRGIVLVLVEACYAMTDPPLRFLRSFLPEIHLGSVRLDLSLPLLFLACSLALNLLWPV